MTETPRASARFLQAFSEIEDFLLHEPEVEADRGFSSAVRFLSRRHAGVKALGPDLLMAQLRNAIVHERRGNLPIAEPHDDVVLEIEEMRDALTRPPSLTAIRPGPVATCTPDETIASAGARMSEGGFSQLPVYGADGLAGLLTTRVIARWVAARHAEGSAAGGETSVAEVMRHAVGSGGTLLSRTATAFDALEAFRSAENDGRVVVALLVTESGQPSEKPLAIVTPADIPALLPQGRRTAL